jgi:hypothetical protein
MDGFSGRPTATGQMDGWPNMHQASSSVPAPYSSSTATYTGVSAFPDTVSQTPSASHHPPPAHHKAFLPAVFGAAGAIAGVLAVFLVIGGLVLWCRRRNKQRAKASGALLTGENASQPNMAMKDVAPRPHGALGNPEPLRRPGSVMVINAGLSTTFSSASPSSMSNVTSPQEPPPVILPATNSSYFTGIDTSDRMSMFGPASIHSNDNIYPSGHEEPPPPYRPRSVPPISREGSLRVVDGMRPNFSTNRNSVARSTSIRSPFDDPLEEDVDIEGDPFDDRSGSQVSDIEYQREPTSTHSTI